MPRPDRRLFLVAYDVPLDRRRTLVEAVCKAYGRRVQYSIFECFLDDLGRDRLERELLREMEIAEDRVAIYHVNEGTSVKLGVTIEPEGQDPSSRIRVV